MSIVTMPSTTLSSETALHQLIVTLKNSTGTDMKLVAISMLNEMFSADAEHKAKIFCMKCDILPYLELIVDSVNLSSFSISDLTLVDTTLRNIWYLSQMPISALQPLLCRKFCRKILSFLDIGSHFYRFCDQVMIRLDEACREKLLIGQSERHSLTGHRLSSVHFHTNNRLKPVKLPENIHACQLFDTSSSDCDVNISEMLLSANLAWPSVDSDQETIVHKESDSETHWEQILITNFVDSHIFWAHVGTDTINSVRNIQSRLESILREATPIQMTNDRKYVCAKGELFGISIFMRGQILKHYGHKVDVFAIDYGLTFDVAENQLYHVPDEVGIMKFPGQVQFCCIKGLQAPPLSESSVEQAAAILCNFCRYSLPAGEILCDLGGLTCLLDLMRCPDSRIRLQIFRTLNNLACNSRTLSKLPVPQLLEDLLGILNSKDEEEILKEISIDCLGNLMYEHTKNKEYFSEYGGFETLLRLMSSSEKERSIYKKSAHVLRLCFKSIDAAQQQQMATSEEEETIISRGKSLPTGKRSSNCKKVSSPDPKPQLHSPLDRDLLRMKLYQDQYSSDSEDEALLQVLPSSDETDGEAIIQKSTMDGVRESCRMVPVDTATAYWSLMAENTYIQGTVVNIRTDAHHEIRPNMTIGNVSASKIACLACGLLNSGKESKIIFGINQDYVVCGIKLTRDERDEFRLGVDRMMNSSVYPSVMHSLFSVRYSPVAKKEGDMTTPIPDVYIAEIILQPGGEIVYSTKSVCYFRHGTSNVALSTQEVRQIVILEEEVKYEKELQKRERELEEKMRMLRSERKDNT